MMHCTVTYDDENSKVLCVSKLNLFRKKQKYKKGDKRK